MAKKENLPLAVDVNEMEPGSSITYANEVVAIIAGIAATEVEGVAAMVSVPNGGNLLHLQITSYIGLSVLSTFFVSLREEYSVPAVHYALFRKRLRRGRPVYGDGFLL